ncbi:MAG: sugar phosphate nucleotidyltransferase [Chloroflexota bacterium]
MSEKLKVVIPMAGFGTRLRPHTWSKPKQLISVAGKAVIDHVLGMFSTLPDPQNIELVFVVGYLGEQMLPHMRENYPHLTVHYVEQEEMRGQSHAVYLTKEHLHGPLLIVFADTLIDTDLSFLQDEEAEAVIWVKPVPDPRRFGVTMVGEDSWVTRLIEKPKDMDNNLAVVGCYYFKRSEDLLTAIEEQMQRGIQLKSEFYLADAINLMLNRGMRMRVETVDVWLDAGTPNTLLETNAYLLAHGCDNTHEVEKRPGVVVVTPVYIHPQAQVESVIVGPNVSVGAGSCIKRSILSDSIIEENARVENAVLQKSWVGCHAQVQGRESIIDIGDHSAITLET